MYITLCGNGNIDSGEVCDKNDSSHTGVQPHATCDNDCLGWHCDSGYVRVHSIFAAPGASTDYCAPAP